jgi:desumoylating isopeptidase 1
VTRLGGEAELLTSKCRCLALAILIISFHISVFLRDTKSRFRRRCKTSSERSVAMDVELYVYDLSQGMARQFSMGLIGQQIDAIYHTSVVFNNAEHFFGQGIHRKVPGTTHHGQPMKVIKLGTTDLPSEVIEEYLQSLESIYTPESYDLFVHNCNNFSQDLAMFLVGESIPDEIRSLPETFLRTPIGQMLRGQIDQSMRTMTQAPDAVSGRNVQRPSGSSVAAKPAVNGQATPAATSKPLFVNGKTAAYSSQPGQVYNITSMSVLNTHLSRASKASAIIFFTSATCPPCKILYPTFDELAGSTPEDQCVFIKVDVSQAYDIGSRYSIRATPTFITFLKGQKLDQWSGADNAALRGNVRLLTQMAAPSYRHQNVSCPTFQRLVESPITFAKMPPLDKLLAKLGSTGKESAVTSLSEFIKHRSSNSANAALPDLSPLSSIYTDTPPDLRFALVDLIRLAALDSRVSSFLTTSPSLVSTILTAPTSGWHSVPFQLRLTACQLIANLFTSPVFQDTLSTTSTPLLDAISALLATSLVDSVAPKVQQSAAAAVYNLACLNHNERLQGRADKFQMSEDIEAAIVSAVHEEEKDAETMRSLLLALGTILVGAPEGGVAEGMCEAMELGSVLKTRESSDGFKDMKSLMREVRSVVEGKP